MDIEEAYALFKNGGSSGGVTQAYVDEHDAAVAAQIPHNTSDLTNDNDFVSKADTDIIASASASDISLTNSADARVQDLKIYGTEDGVGEGGLTVTATGKNLFNGWEKNKWINAGDGAIYSGANSAISTFIRVRPNTDYYISGLTDELQSFIAFYGKNYDYIRRTSGAQRRTEQITTAVNCYYIVITEFVTAETSAQTIDVLDALKTQVEMGNAESGYNPYRESTLPLTTALPLQRIMKTVDLGDFDWVYQPNAKSNYEGVTFARFYTSTAVTDEFFPVPDYITGSGNYALEAMTVSDRYTVSHAAGGNDPIIDKAITMSKRGIIYVTDNDYTDAATFKAAVTGITLTYPSYCDEIDLADGIAITRIDDDGETVLSEPVVTPLTDAEIQAFRAFRTFEGVTNIAATDDPHITVEYIKNTDNGKAVARVQDSATIKVSSLLTLTAAGWTNNTQTVAYAHDTSKLGMIDVTPADIPAWGAAGVYAMSETAQSITFSCANVPSVALTFRVTSMEVSAE